MSPDDALRVINDVNAHTARVLEPQANVDHPPYLDVSNDGWVSPVDALLVINYLNAPHAYDVNVVLNNLGETEYQLFAAGFHFGTFLRQATTNVIAFRPHPDQGDINGWGSTLYVGPFIGGADSSGGRLRAFEFIGNTIRIAATGDVAAPGGETFGTWTWEAHLRYDTTKQRITTEHGSLEITLPDNLSAAAGDLNVFRIHSNLLENVPRRFHPDGDTGDMKRVDVAYATGADPRNFSWQPQLVPAHYPIDASNYLATTVVGEFNDVDSQRLGLPGNIAPARKPTLAVTLFTVGQNIITFGGSWNQDERLNPYADNVGITPLVRRGATTLKDLEFIVVIESYRP